MKDDTINIVEYILLVYFGQGLYSYSRHLLNANIMLVNVVSIELLLFALLVINLYITCLRKL